MIMKALAQGLVKGKIDEVLLLFFKNAKTNATTECGYKYNSRDLNSAEF